MSRTAQFFLLIGTNGTGKTTQLKKFLAINSRNLIIAPNRFDSAWDKITHMEPTPEDLGRNKIKFNYPDINNFTGERKTVIEHPNQVSGITHPVLGFRNGGLFLDDFKNYIPSRGTLPPDIIRLFSDRRHKMIDIFAATHSWGNVNPDFMTYDPVIIQFRTTRPITKEVANKVENFEKLKASFDRVNRKAQTNPYYFEILKPSEL
jgi:hypothetical protein